MNQTNWLSLVDSLPKPHEWVFWYDAMFDIIMYLALAEPSTHDGDFSHYSKELPTNRPEQYNFCFGHKPVGWYPSKETAINCYTINTNPNKSQVIQNNREKGRGRG